jgi:hypothetical protein
MKTAIELNLTYNQILSMVKQLPWQQKVKLTRELEKEVVNKKLSRLLKTFKADEVDMKTIEEEVEIVRQQLYEKEKD